MTRSNRKYSPSTTLSLHAPDATAVFIAGTFNGWKPDTHPMKRSEDGWWTIILDLSPGSYEYKFVVDGVWCCTLADPASSEADLNCVPNEFGTANRTLSVKG